MPTLFRIDGARVVIYPGDHPLAHVHVRAAGAEAIFELNCPGGPVSVRTSNAVPDRTLRRYAEVLDREVAELCRAWDAIYADR